MTDHNQLLPCPFCGSNAERFEVPGDMCVLHYVACTNTACNGQNGYSPSAGYAIERWNTRVQLPAGGAVPDGWKLLPAVATLAMKNAGWQEADRQGIDPESIEMQTIWNVMLSAAPHPVSGEQKPIGKVLSEEEMGIGHDRKAGPVLWFGKPVPGLIYAAPPAAQDVSGLPDRPTEEMKRAGANAMADAQRDGSSSFYAYAAVCWEAMAEAHRAQAQGGDV